MEDEHLENVLSINIRKNTDNTKGEVENMVRRAETLKSISELKLSDRTQKQIIRKIGTNTKSIIEAGRRMAFNNDMHPEYANRDPKYKQELVGALDEAGFIRHDLYPRTWRVWAFYAATLQRFVHPSTSTTLVGCRHFISDEEYEDMPAISDEDFEKVMTALDSLTEREKTILVLRWGLDYGVPRATGAVGKILGITCERVRQLEAKALRKLRAPSCLCKFPALFGFVPPAEPEPVVAGGVKDIDINTDILYLKLSVRAYNCLKRYAQINTVDDIINYPKEDWPKIKNLGRKATLEIQNKMHAAGYPDFTVNILS